MHFPEFDSQGGAGGLGSFSPGAGGGGGLGGNGGSGANPNYGGGGGGGLDFDGAAHLLVIIFRVEVELASDKRGAMPVTPQGREVTIGQMRVEACLPQDLPQLEALEVLGVTAVELLEVPVPMAAVGVALVALPLALQAEQDSTTEAEAVRAMRVASVDLVVFAEVAVEVAS